MADLLDLSLDEVFSRESRIKEEPAYSPEIEQAAAMLEAMDEDTQALMLQNIKTVYGWDQERRELHQEIYELLTERAPDPKRSSVVTARLRGMHRSVSTGDAHLPS